MIDTVIPVLIAVAAFAVLLPIIVFVHEYGHFKMARICGVRVETFSIGFGPALFRRTDRKGTVWKVAAIPLGGFVKFFGDANAASAGTSTAAAEDKPGPATTQFGSEKERLEAVLTEEEKRVCFHFKPVWQRALIVAAGPLSNFLLAIAIFTVLLSAIGEGRLEPVVSRVVADTAAAEAGFEVGDRITAINGRTVKDFDEVRMKVQLSSDTPLTFEVMRGGNMVELVATPRRVTAIDGFGNEIRAGQLGINVDGGKMVWKRYNPIEAVGAGTARVWMVLDVTTDYLGRLITGREDPRQLGGPVKIAQYAGQAASSGFNAEVEASLTDRILTSLTNFINLAALVSVSIGFLNLLPVPVLDGGHLVYYAYEAVAGRPLSEKVQGVGFRIGVALVGTLMVFVIINDVIQLF